MRLTTSDTKILDNHSLKRRVFLNRKTLSLYWQQARKYKTSLLISFFFVPLGALLIDTAVPYYAGQVIASLTNNTQQTYHFIMLMSIVGLLGIICNYAGFQSLLRHESSVTKDLVDETFSSIIHRDITFFNNQKLGAMTSNFINFVHSHIALQDLLIIRTLGFLLSIGSGLIILAFHTWQIALLLLVFITGLMLQIRFSMHLRKKWRTERRKIRSQMHGDIADAFTNNLIVKTFASEAHEQRLVAKKSSLYRKYYLKDMLFFSTEGSARVMLMTIIQIVTVSLSVYYVTHNMMSLAIAIFVIAYMQRIASQIFTLGEIINGYDQALLDAEPMTQMLSQKNSINDSKDAVALTPRLGEISFQDMSYRYNDANQDVLNNVNLLIPGGQKIGLVGKSGAGKSTIAKLLLRFKDVTNGKIAIDGYDIRHITQKSLRDAISYVPQEPLLFHRSLRENIAYGKLDATEEEIIAAAKRANAWEFIQKLPHGLDTLVGERGVKLSGGQRQRIAIARAILKDAPILVLDEATSALDSESEKLIQDSLHELMKNRTAIVIAHRLSTIAKLDRIIVLDNGRIVEDGTHTQLLKQNGTYAKLWSHQSGGFIEE